MLMLHPNGQAPRRGKHSIVTFALIKTKPGRRRHFGRSADTSADHPATPRTDGPRLVTISEQKAFRHPELRRDVESSIVETFRLNLTSNKSKIRGSTRIPCDIPATLISLDPVHPFSESCHIVLVNLNGCAARSSCSVGIGLPVGLHGLGAVANITARVVNCISLGKHEKLWLLGLALDRPGNVWGIETPPDDWTC